MNESNSEEVELNDIANDIFNRWGNCIIKESTVNNILEYLYMRGYRTPQPRKECTCKHWIDGQITGPCVVHQGQPPKDSGLMPLTEQDLDDVIMSVFPNQLHKVYSLRNDIIAKFGHPPLPRRVDAAEIEPILHRIISHVDQDMEIKFCPTYTMAQAIAAYLNGDKS